MESLALLVGGMYLGEILFGLVTLGFAITYRAKAKFGVTSLVLISILALETAVAMQMVAFGLPALICLVPAALLRFLPRRKK